MIPDYDDFLKDNLTADFLLKELDKKSKDISLSIQENCAYHTAYNMVVRLSQDVYFSWIKHKQDNGEWDAD